MNPLPLMKRQYITTLSSSFPSNTNSLSSVNPTIYNNYSTSNNYFNPSTNDSNSFQYSIHSNKRKLMSKTTHNHDHNNNNSSSRSTKVCDICNFADPILYIPICGHTFHSRCVHAWPLQKCPICDNIVESINTVDLDYTIQPEIRCGKWTKEEELFVQAIIQEFEFGSLPLANGTPVRLVLAKLLNCSPMRLSKKFQKNALGKRTYRVPKPKRRIYFNHHYNNNYNNLNDQQDTNLYSIYFNKEMYIQRQKDFSNIESIFRNQIIQLKKNDITKQDGFADLHDLRIAVKQFWATHFMRFAKSVGQKVNGMDEFLLKEDQLKAANKKQKKEKRMEQDKNSNTNHNNNDKNNDNNNTIYNNKLANMTSNHLINEKIVQPNQKPSSFTNLQTIKPQPFEFKSSRNYDHIKKNDLNKGKEPVYLFPAKLLNNNNNISSMGQLDKNHTSHFQHNSFDQNNENNELYHTNRGTLLPIRNEKVNGINSFQNEQEKIHNIKIDFALTPLGKKLGMTPLGRKLLTPLARHFSTINSFDESIFELLEMEEENDIKVNKDITRKEYVQRTPIYKTDNNNENNTTNHLVHFLDHPDTRIPEGNWQNLLDDFVSFGSFDNLTTPKNSMDPVLNAWSNIQVS